MVYEFIKENSKFYPVVEEDIKELQSILTSEIPKELREFWIDVGYGFISGTEGNTNRIMDPLSVRDFRLREGDFEYSQDIEIYDEFEEDKVIFFEGNESVYISIEVSNDSENAIFYYDVKIADSLKDFLEKIKENDEYYIDML